MSGIAPQERKLALAIDVGGTNIKAGLIARDGSLLHIERVATPAGSAPEVVAQQILELARGITARQGLSMLDVDGIGISLAGFISAGGLVTATAHLSQEWVGYDLHERLMRDLPTRYYFALDTPAPTLGEAYFGAGRGVRHFAYLTVSTGIGAGIMADGRYWVGGLGWAGGVGHTIIDETSERVCGGCGNRGCLETFAAKQGIVANALEAVAQHPDSAIIVLAGGDTSCITPDLVCKAARAGDAAAVEVFERAGHALGIGLTNFANIVSPERIVVGGGIAQAGDLLLEPARRVVRERAFPPVHRTVEIVQAALGDFSGIYGAAALVFYDLRVNAPEETTR